MKISKGLQNTSSLTVFSISRNNISEAAADDIAAVLSHNTNAKQKQPVAVKKGRCQVK